ncbi:phosphotransferase enzyme family protein [Arthrobacter castelli]|uniref:phosphotransferase enzyme family protein n=1 Tax=Arthrobacter castelli TaxID=271431 RepID=UPI000407835F|nr:phosphotransferase [Arthrobacter castelli]
MTSPTNRQQAEAVRTALGDDVVEYSATSIYEWGQVFKARLAVAGGDAVDAVVKPTLSEPEEAAALGQWQRHVCAAGLWSVQPLELQTVELPLTAGDTTWMAYPWIEGSPWSGTVESINAAGRGLGLLHAASSTFNGVGMPDFDWPVFSQESVDEDVEAIGRACRDQAGHLDSGGYPVDSASAASRWTRELRAFHGETLPAIRDASLPTYPVSLDYRAANLIYAADGQPPAFIDFENGEVAPRLLDVAVSVLLFASESESNPGRLFTQKEWKAYLAGYLEAAPALTDQEVALWPEALKYMRLEWGTWHLTDGAEWDFPGEGSFLRDLLTLQETTRFPLELNSA